MRLISDTILEEVLQREPTFPAIFPSVGNFNLGSPSAFMSGQPFEHFKLLREKAPISWTPLPRKARGFWSLTRYDDVKAAVIWMLLDIWNCVSSKKIFLFQNLSQR